MPVITTAAMKLMIILLGASVVLTPLAWVESDHHPEWSQTVRERGVGSHYEIIIPAKDGGRTHIIINRKKTTWGREQIVPFDGIVIFDKDGRFVQEFNPLENIDNPNLVRDNFAKFFEQLPKDKVEAIAPWLEKAVRDYDGLLKELEKKAEKE